MSECNPVDETTVDAAVGPGVAARSALVQVAIGQIEAALRSVNERIRELAPAWDGMLAVVCECADPHCLRTFTVPIGIFDELRASPRRFAVAPGHERAGFESIVLCADDYFVVSRPLLPAGDSVLRP
jgi:hypothetical protein